MWILVIIVVIIVCLIMLSGTCADKMDHFDE